jgi:hypothetical protein
MGATCTIHRIDEKYTKKCKDDSKKTGYEGLNWIQMAQDRVQWQPLTNMVIKLQVPYTSM